MPDPIALSHDQTAFFQANGYVGPFDLDAPELVAAARKLIDEECVEKTSPVYGVVSRRDWHLVARPIYDLCSQPAIVERLASLLGPDILLWRTQMFYKKPGDGATLWHQDYNVPGPFRVPSIDPPVTITAWIALDDATIENGCVELIAGSHLEGRLVGAEAAVTDWSQREIVTEQGWHPQQPITQRHLAHLTGRRRVVDTGQRRELVLRQIDNRSIGDIIRSQPVGDDDIRDLQRQQARLHRAKVAEDHNAEIGFGEPCHLRAVAGVAPTMPDHPLTTISADTETEAIVCRRAAVQRAARHRQIHDRAGNLARLVVAHPVGQILDGREQTDRPNGADRRVSDLDSAVLTSIGRASCRERV